MGHLALLADRDGAGSRVRRPRFWLDAGRSASC